MKRINLVASFAVVLAIASAFTTSNKFVDQNWFRLKTTLPTVSVFQTQGTTQGNFDYIQTYMNVTPYHADDAINIVAACPDVSGKVCAARIPSFTGGSSATQLDQTDLDNLGSTYPTQIKFKNI